MASSLTIQVTAEQYPLIVAAAAKQGIAIAGDSGQVSAHGCKIAFAFDPAAGQLSFTVLSAPPLCTSRALHTIQDLVEGVISQPATAPAAPAESSSQ